MERSKISVKAAAAKFTYHYCRPLQVLLGSIQNMDFSEDLHWRIWLGFITALLPT